MCGLSWLALLRLINKKRAEFNGERRPDQAHAPSLRRAGVVNSSRDRMHVQSLRLKGDGQFFRAAAERQQLLVWILQQVCEDHRAVIAAQEVPLSAAQGQEGEVVLVTTALVWAQPTEEEDQELFIWWEMDKKMLNNSQIKNSTQASAAD